MSRLISLTHSVEFLVALLTSAIGCSSGGNSSNKTFCSPGDTQLCVGANGCKGGQQCTKDGSGWSVCDCGSTVTSAGSSSIAGGSAVGGGSSTGGGSSSGSVPIAGNEQTSGGTKGKWWRLQHGRTLEYWWQLRHGWYRIETRRRCQYGCSCRNRRWQYPCWHRRRNC